jgi:hypothetical protein
MAAPMWGGGAVPHVPIEAKARSGTAVLGEGGPCCDAARPRLGAALQTRGGRVVEVRAPVVMRPSAPTYRDAA